MRILQLIYESFGSPFGFGGAGVRAYEIYGRLKDRHDITLLCMKYRGARDGDIEGLRHVFAGTESNSLTRSVISYTFKAANFVRRYGDGFDVIVENFLPSTPFFSRVFSRTPVILQIQGVMERHSLIKFHPFYAAPMYIVERYYPRLYNRFVFVSDITEAKVMRRIRRGVILCSVIPNGIDAKLLNISPVDGDYLLFFSRIDIYTKGLDLLTSAFEQISPEYPNLKLILAGFEFDRYEKLVSGLSPSVRRKIEYAGFVSGDEKARLLAGARISVLPSRHESSPISILEAAACGKPVIVSDIPELDYVCRQGFGISFPSGSVNGLREKITMLLNDDTKRISLGRKGREFSSHFLWEHIAVQFEDVLKQTVESGH
jgi:glycosyltransferase involved in cell wall biosynthesis